MRESDVFRIVKNAVKKTLSNPMPRGSVCYTPEQKAGAPMSEYRKGTIGAVLPGTLFYYHGRDGQKIFKMRMLRDEGGTGRYMYAEITKILEPHPNDMEIAEQILSRVHGGELALTTRDEKYISLQGSKPLLAKPVWKGGQS